MQVTGLHVHVERSFAAAGLDAGDALHLGGRFEVLEVVGLVDEDVIDAKLIELCGVPHNSTNVERPIMWSE